MKKHLLPSALILLLGIALAWAQTITKSVQLSQDSTGAIGFDTQNNIYFPAHILTVGPGAPTAVAIAGTAPTIASTSTDFVGSVAGGGASTTGVTVGFNTVYNAPPTCLVTWATASATEIAYTTSASALFISSGVGAGTVNYLCSGRK